jgi:hypothetical protein
MGSATPDLRDTAADHPHVLYLGLQKAGSSYLRGYFSAHPGIVWTREAGRLLSADGAKTYLAAAGTAFAAALENRKAETAKQPIWIDMQESVALGYQFRPGHAWRADVMFSTGTADGHIDPSPPDFFTSLNAICPGSLILLTIRSQPDWLFSNYHHHIHSLPAARRSFADYLQTVDGRIIAATAHFDRLVERLHAAFGRERVLVLPLELLERDTEGTLRRLSAFLGCSYVPFEPAEKDLNRGVDYRRGAGRDEIPMLVRPAEGAGHYQRILYYARYALGLLGKERAFAIPSKASLAKQYGPVIAPLYALSNYRLAKLLDCDLGALGYPL